MVEEVLDSEVAEEIEQPADDAADAEIPAAETQDSTDVTSGGGARGSDGADASSGIDAELLALQQAYGFQLDANDPKSFVKSMAVALDRELQQLGRGGPQHQQQATSPQQAQAAKEAGLDLEALLKEHFPEAEIDPALRKGLQVLATRLSEHHGQQLAALKAEFGQAVTERMGQMESYLQAQENERISGQLDGFFSNLGQEWAGEFGAGTVRQMAPQSAQLKARNAVVEDAADLRSAYLLRNQQPPPIDQLLKRALHARYADETTTIARRQLVNQVAQRKTQATAGASQKRSAPPSGREKAEATWVAGLRKLGIKQHGEVD